MQTKTSLPGLSRSFAILTLGCKVNTYESDLIAQQMRQAGFTEKSFEECCDIYIVNTCTVTNIADRKSRKMLHRAKKKNPAALLVAAGCYVDAVQQGKGLPDGSVDLWICNREKLQLAKKCLAVLRAREQSEAAQAREKEAEVEAEVETEVETGSFLTSLDGHTRAFIKVEDGCNLFCTYCIIPYVRGRVKARPVADTIREVRILAEGGVTEVVLTGIHLSSMGDELLETIEEIEKLPAILRIRLGSLEPRWITEEVVKRLQSCKKLCPHFHLSLQSGSDQILESMHRRYSTEEFAGKVRLLREAFPDVAITTDIIVGFPGETEKEFQETLDFAEKIGFYEAHVFPYSRRKGTVADRMRDQVEENVKADRSRRLIAETSRHSSLYRQLLLGKSCEFLAEEVIRQGTEAFLTGYTRQYVRCLLPWDSFRPAWAGQLFTGRAEELKVLPGLGECLILR